MTTRLVLLLGDQVGPDISSLAGCESNDTRVLMCEVGGEVTYAPHHARKLVLIFSAMRHCARRLREQGWTVDYVTLDDPDNSHTLAGELARAVERLGPDEVRITEPGEWRVRRDLDTWAEDAGVSLQWCPDDRFIADHQTFRDWASGRRSLRMEHFYRIMRRSTGLLMEGDEPTGGKWNYDADNRRPLDEEARSRIPGPWRVEPDAITRDVVELVRERCPDAFGAPEPFWFAVTPEDAEAALEHFIQRALPDFGDFQDAMAAGEDFGFHAVISIYLNLGLLDPLDCCRRAEAAWHDGHAPLNAVEGFIRQILGWREFIRGIYWLQMPDYAGRNALQARLDLPDFYWTGDTGMRCLSETIRNVRDNAYGHHIQRLMVTGNFALIAGIQPAQVCDWYLGVFADAFEWVELPNTLGMALYGDGGLFASKPYAASGKYIQRMSDYCDGCRYRPQDATGERACPFNYLYWDFIARQEQRLRGNPRMGMIYRTLERMDPQRVEHMRRLARRARRDLDAL